MPVPFHETLGSTLSAPPHSIRLWDAGLCADGKIRIFLGGTPAEQIFSAGLLERRVIGDGVMIVTRGAAGNYPLALSDGTSVRIPITSYDNERFRDKRCLLLMRINETPAQIHAALCYHHKHHGAQAVVIINRNPQDDPNFASVLKSFIDKDLEDFDLLVCDLNLPSGHHDQSAQTHPFNAPDAPRKDRMTPPEPDAWRSGLEDIILYEMIRWRWLGLARSVVSLEACDIIPLIAPGKGIFQLAEANGYINLIGTPSYPWRLRANHEPQFSDHICVLFDNQTSFGRWACAPAKLNDSHTWRQNRIANAYSLQNLPFFRAIALRVRDDADAPLAPKTSLILSSLANDLSQALGGKPISPPKSVQSSAKATAPNPTELDSTPKVAIVTTMKNEAPFILEWLAYHRVIGVSDFLIYTNDCDDGTDTFLQLLMQKGLCQWRENPFKNTDLKPQHAALQAAEDEPIMQNCDWGICMDVDEFINIKIGDGTLNALFHAMESVLPGANMISLTWRLLGNSEVHQYQDKFLIEQFDRAAQELSRKPHQAWGFKTLFRNVDIFKKLGVHRPKGLKPDLWDQIRWLNGSGQILPKTMFRNGWRSTKNTYGYDWVQLNHYAVRSAESFLVKRDRGRVNHVERDQGLNYWFRMNHNGVEERSIQRMLPLVQAEFNRLMSDPEIKACHEIGIAHHRAKINELQSIEHYSKFYQTLTSKRMEKICRMQPHFGSAVFSAGPDSIPLDLNLDNVGPDFFFTIEYDGDQQH